MRIRGIVLKVAFLPLVEIWGSLPDFPLSRFELKVRSGYYTEGGKYIGHWVNNKMNGRGTLYYLDDRIAYEGEWRDDELHGLGKLYNEKPLRVGNGGLDAQ